MANFETHVLADIFPPMEGQSFEAFVADIEANGLLEPIVLCGGKILDGRNRYRAMERLGRELGGEDIVEFTGDNPLTFIISANLHRRHLGESQRGMVAARIANMRQGERTDLEPSANLQKVDRATAATLLNVSERTVASAAAVCATGNEGLIAAVDSGEIKVSVAAGLVEKGTEFAAAVIEKVGTGVKVTEALRQTRKEMLPAEIAKLPAGVYRVIYADPPWKYNDTRRTDDHRQSTGVLEHYCDMTVEEICALDVNSIAAKDSVLLMWGTFPLLLEALHVISVWGFTYKTAFVWDKGHGSFGHYHDAEAELLFVATRRSCVPDSDKREKQIQRFARVKGHSRKPEEWRTLIDRQWGNHGTKKRPDRIELFRRGGVPKGWDTWGAEAQDAAE